MAYNIFLSHSGVDQRWVQWIADNARSIDINVYMYEHDIQPGTSIATKVQSAIESCQALVVLLTPNGEYSPYVQQEIGFAQAKGKPIIPLVQPGVSPRCLAMLEGVEYISFNPKSPELALSHLLNYLVRLKDARETDQAILLGLGTLFILALLSKRDQGKRSL
jgi:hypothetical protein